MSSGCGDVLSLEDLVTAKKHQLFEAEVITGHQGGVSTGALIDYATNAVTGQVQKTLPAILRDIGFDPVSWDFSTGGTLTVNDRNKVVYDPVSHTWYSYSGTLPVTVPAGYNPVGQANWTPQTDPTVRGDLAAPDGLKMLGACESIAQLKGIAGSTEGQLIRVKAYATGTGIGGGLFQWDADSTRTDDGGTVIAVTGVTTGRWLRLYMGDRTPQMFGAMMNGIDDDTAAHQRMADSANNSAVLADNFFGTFQIRGKTKTTATINWGRPIKVDAYGAEFICTGSYPCVSFSMHNGLWEGGYFNYTNVANSTINENARAMVLAPETNPIQVMNSTIRGIRVWGAHTGIWFDNPSTNIWMLHLENLEIGVRAGSSSQKARAIWFGGTGGTGGNTTVSLSKIAPHPHGDIVGVGFKAYDIKGVNEVSFYDCSMDGGLVGSGDIMDIEAFRCTVTGFHIEQITNDVGIFTDGPFTFNCNSLYLDGFEMLLISNEKGGAWITPKGNGVFEMHTWHAIPASGKQVGKIVDLSFWNTAHDPNAIINFVGNIPPSAITGGNTRHKVQFSVAPSVYGINTDQTVVSAQNILDLGFERQAAIVTVLGEKVSSPDLSFFSQVICLRNATGGWTMVHNTAKSTNFASVIMNYGFTGNNLAWLIAGDTGTYRLQCKIVDDRAPLSSYF